ncbi:NADH-quinone oxidoreductase subunit C [Thermomonospora echinospora]|uniref:NADH-quinone oxidoreductase n=1 Tax=Thermomonospora echinospora TaxID=1992 RepID=A0A1H5Z3M7_9ACTN|nr:NADH-quinone oxidoreductase subunit C [Thermomonospora echinospora]SEG30872.1 NADH-quinone oxidoreductase subunit C [Thermomonospora echinospora]
MNAREPAAAWAERFGEDAVLSDSFGQPVVDVPAVSWLAALDFARTELDCDYFDWLTAVDEQADGFRVVVHVYSLRQRHHLLIRTLVARERPLLPTATGVYRGAAWHERETYEMFGVVFDGHPDLKPLLLPDGFQGNPLRKDFVLAARVAKPWPGAKEPGESGTGAPSRRRVRPPGVPDDWGPQATTSARPDRPSRPERPPRPERPGRGTRPGGAEPVRGAESSDVAGASGRGETGGGGERPDRGEGSGGGGPSAGGGPAGADESPGRSEESGEAGRGRRPRGIDGGGDA